MEKITSIEKYVTFIMNMKREKDKLGLNSFQWFFRGQKNSNWSAMPSVFRNDNLSVEYNTIQRAIGQNPFEFRSLTEFETLTKLQHYGLATRLLDITLNPLVALYFATEPEIEYEKGKDTRYKQVEKDGIVFFQYTAPHMLQELSVKIATVIPFIDFENSYSVGGLLEYLKESSVISDTEYGILKDNNYKLFVEYIQKNYFILSSHSNERLSRQSGAFILPTAISIKEEDKEIEEKIVEKSSLSLNDEFDDYIIIPAKDKSAIREELDFFNINEATMFPELEHQMVYIQNKNVAKIGSSQQFIPYVDKPKEEILEYNDFQPDITKILKLELPSISEEILQDITTLVTEQISFVDWKSKYQIRSLIRLNISKMLQKELSARDSKMKSEKILELLLNPSEDCRIREA